VRGRIAAGLVTKAETMVIQIPSRELGALGRRSMRGVFERHRLAVLRLGRDQVVGRIVTQREQNLIVRCGDTRKNSAIFVAIAGEIELLCTVAGGRRRRVDRAGFESERTHQRTRSKKTTYRCHPYSTPLAPMFAPKSDR